MFNDSCSIIIVAHSVIIAKLAVDPDLAGWNNPISVLNNKIKKIDWMEQNRSNQ